MFKENLKRHIPKSVLNLYSQQKAKLLLRKEWSKDKKRYVKYATLTTPAKFEEAIDSSLIFHAHSIEKGLSHPNFRPNFGKNALVGLKQNLIAYQDRGYSKSNFSYLNALSVLRAYKEAHDELNIDTPTFNQLFEEKDYMSVSRIGGTMLLKRDEMATDSDVQISGLDDLENSRHSVRTFADTSVDQSKIYKAIGTSLKTPSVCNRQPWHVEYTDNVEKINNIIELQGGYAGYGMPPLVALISVDLKDFRGAYERNEAYVDGGLFLMNFLLSLTNQGLASCTLNMMLTHNRLTRIRQILDVNDSEVLIALVAIGNYPETYVVPKSARKDVKSVLRYIK